MKHLSSTLLRCGRAVRQRRMLVRTLSGCAYAGMGLAVVVLAVGAALYMRLSAGPLAVAGLEAGAAGALAERMGPGWTVTLRNTALQLDRGSLALRAAGLDIRNPDGVLVVRAPLAIVSVDFMSLLVASPRPRSIELRDLQLRAAISRGGSLSFMAAGEGAVEAASAPAAVAVPGQVTAAGDAAGDAAAPPSALSVALGALFDLILDPANITGALDRARIANARSSSVGAA